MADRHITYKIKPFVQGDNVADATDVELSTTNFDNNLDNTVVDVQALAEAVDNLTAGGGGGMPMPSLGGLHLDIPTRVDVNADLTGEHTVHFRVYNHTLITSLSLFIDEGGLFQTHSLVAPTSNGSQSQTFNISALSTTANKQLVFYLVANNNQVAGAYVVQVDTIEGTEVTIDGSALTSITVSDAQDVAIELNNLRNIVDNMGGDTGTRLGALTPFATSVTVDATNFENYDNEIGLYTRNDDAAPVNFNLPTETVINNRYPVTITLLNQAGTFRSTSAFNPMNEIRVQTQGADTLRRTSSTGTLLSFGIVRRNDLATITKSADGEPWVININELSTGALLLPDGIFNLHQSATASIRPSLNAITISTPGSTIINPSSGDAFRVNVGGDLNGYPVATGDVLVALIDNPSRLLTNNNDWLLIKNSHNNTITLSELHFLNQITEVDSFSDSRLIDRSDVNEVNVWLSPFILDHAPFLNPSTDPDNPQSGETDSYVGGREDRGTDNEFELSSSAPNSIVYVDIDGGFPLAELSNTFLVHRGRDGTEIERFNLQDDFRGITLTGSSDTYYVLDDVGATDNFTNLNYINQETISIVHRDTNMQFNFAPSVNVIGSIGNGEIDISKLDNTTQALITSNHAITHDQTLKLEGLTLNDNNVAIPNTEPLYIKLNEASTTNDLSHYQNVEQQNGIIPNYERTRQIFFLADPSINLTGLQKVDTPATKLSVTSRGRITTTDSQGNQRQWDSYSATLPAITGNNSVLDNAWQMDGTKNNSVLGGAIDSFKVGLNNLRQDVIDRFDHTVVPPTLPPQLQSLSDDLTVETRTETGWRSLENPIRSDLTRQFALLWDEPRTEFRQNYFDDITPAIEVIGFNDNNIFHYADPNDRLNTSFPGAGSYVLNDNVRVRNTSPNTTPITDELTKLIGFDYALERRLTDSDNEPMVRLGTTGEPLMSLAGEEGLYLSIGRGDGGQHTRTYEEPLRVDNGHLGTHVDVSTFGESEIEIPQSGISNGVTIHVSIELDNNGNDEGTHTEQITITNLGTDQAFGNITWDFASFPDVTMTVRYEHNNTDLSIPRRVLFLVPTHSFTNAALTYNVSATVTITETWNTSTTYARYPINAGNSHDDFGLFDPSRWNTEHVEERNRVLLLLQTYRENDTSADPEMAVKVVVDGEREGSASDNYVIRLHRPKSDFTFNDINLGNTICAISHIQVYDYDNNFTPSETEMLTLYNSAHRWLGAFTNDDFRTDRFVFGADIELADNEYLILNDTQNTNRYAITVDNGVLTTTQL